MNHSFPILMHAWKRTEMEVNFIFTQLYLSAKELPNNRMHTDRKQRGVFSSTVLRTWVSGFSELIATYVCVR